MAPERTMEFIGVSTAGSSSLQLFGRWAEVLGVADARLVGRDLPLNAGADVYRSAVESIAGESNIVGALVTTHKVGIHASAANRFDELDPLAQLCGEVSCISKRSGHLIGHAKDPVTAGRTLAGMLGADHFSRTGGQVLCLGAGGAGVALLVHFLTQVQAAERPERIVVSDTSRQRLDVVREIYERQGADPPALVTAEATRTTELLDAMPAGSLIVNATGMGKDVPGSPIEPGVPFPRSAVVWELNYRGTLPFLESAKAQAAERDLTVFDGWRYFLHGWSEHLAEVFGLRVTSSTFERFRQVSDEWRQEQRSRSES
ncbi:MAG TPA: hypothetical protein VHX59_02405 [Mycobacteriales bacterium]|jgi:shikimate 5-dehydrogenase|nr:hypothetical protein [Mycobacteriales bacterium]